jgi:hypothetical protein
MKNYFDISSGKVEYSALKLIHSKGHRKVNAPAVIDFTICGDRAILLTSWIDGIDAEDAWGSFDQHDKTRLIDQLRLQIRAMRELIPTPSPSSQGCITLASGDPVLDPRVPWVGTDDGFPITPYKTSREFMARVWTATYTSRINPILPPLINPLIEREDIPIVFCHGDILPKNILIPGGLARWRRGETMVCLIDWEMSGWMPLPWEALKATWLTFEPDDEWRMMMFSLFPDCQQELTADWEWRLRSNVTIV